MTRNLPHLVEASWCLPARQSRSPLSLAILPGCFLRAFASEFSLDPTGEPGRGATEEGRLGGSGGNGLFERSRDGVPEMESDILCSVPGVLGVADG